MKNPKSKSAQRQSRIDRQSRKNYLAKVAKLQRAGLLDKVDLRKSRDPKARRAILKYDDFLSGRAAAIKTDKSTAKQIRQKFGAKGKGDIVILPKEKHERIKINRKGEVVSQRPNPLGGTIHKIKGKRELSAPEKNEKLYYTIPERKRGLGTLSRHTFSNFDDLLYYLSKYEIDFDDIEPFIETEYVTEGGRKSRALGERITRERREASRKSRARIKRKRRAEKRKPAKRKAKRK